MDRNGDGSSNPSMKSSKSSLTEPVTSGISSCDDIRKVSRGIGRGRKKKLQESKESGIGSGLATSENLSSSVLPSGTPSGVGTPFNAPSSGTPKTVSDAESVDRSFSDGPVKTSSTPALSDGPSESELSALPADYKLANCNCINLGITGDMAVFAYKCFFLPSNLSEIDKRLFLAKDDVLRNLGLKAAIYSKDVLYLPKETARKVTIESSVKSKRITLTLSPPEKVTHLEGFLTQLLIEVSSSLQQCEAFRPLSLISGRMRFEVFPGEVLTVLNEERDKMILRCDSTISKDFGSLDTIINQVRLFACKSRMREEVMRELVDRQVKDLVVFSVVDRQLLIVERVEWNEKPKKNEERQQLLRDKSIVSDPDGAFVRCRRINSTTSSLVEPEVLGLRGSKRVPCIGDSGDAMVEVLGGLVTGQQRQLAMLRFTELVEESPETVDILREWNLNLIGAAVMSNGVVLKTELLKVGGGSRVIAGNQGWLNRLSEHQVLSPVHIRSWMIVYHKGDQHVAAQLEDQLRNEGPNLGIRISKAIRKAVLRDEAEDYKNAMRDAVDKVELIVVIMRSNREDIYKTVKRWALLDNKTPVPTQVIMKETAHMCRNRPEICCSILTQINCKLGGDLWALDVPLKDTMIIGLSSYSDLNGDDYVGFVASKNQLFTQWFSYVYRLTKKEELLSISRRATEHYKKNNKGDSARQIIVYRHNMDTIGVDDRDQIGVLRDAFEEARMVVVNIDSAEDYARKVISALQLQDDDTMKSLNRNRFMIPVNEKKYGATAIVPCQMIVNESRLSSKDIQRLSTQLKHLYFNVCGEISLPAPCIYAQKCAEFVVDILDGQQTEALGEKLYYL